MVLGICLFSLVMQAFAGSPVGNAYILPVKMERVRQPVFKLDGSWLFRYSPESKWSKILVPGEATMQGYAIEHDKPFVYRKLFTIPSDYAGHCIILRFDGVYSQARLSINGRFVREHQGGFTRWETDVTSYVYPGKKNEIWLEVTDRLDDISYASGYAHHPIGGILRSVTMFVQPQTHLFDIGIETRLDSLYQDAVLHFTCEAVHAATAEAKLELIAPDGNPVQLVKDRFPLVAEQNVWEIPVRRPLKWDAEHPNLYTLNVVLQRQQKEIYRFTRKVGFREVRIVGDRMLVNGQPVKLRGACRHDIHPTLGRTTTPELDSLDVVLFKEANMNFVRTSHYPPSEQFLEYCDRLGIYVECETAVCFVDTYRQKNYAPGATQDDPAYADRYLGQCQEMVKSFGVHPSVLFWSIGNESAYGKNFQLCWDWVKANDQTRPVIFSYPGSVNQQEKIYDILSMHYQDVNGNVSQWGMTTRGFQGHGIPALFDEWAHPACYTYATLRTDPNIREFWGQSLDKMWSGLFGAPGGLGGAIWGYVDETFMLPEPKVGTSFWKEFAHTAKPEGYRGNCVGYGEWGIVDVWRRQKPEFWSTKKAYSPVRLLADRIGEFTSGQRLLLPVYNRFDHTNLNEIRATYIYQGKKKELVLPALLPHQKGVLLIPAEAWEEGESLLLEFNTVSGGLIDAYRFVLGKEKIEYPESFAKGELQIIEDNEYITVLGEGFEIPFQKSTGLICGAKAGENVFIEEGPFLNLYVNLNHLSGAEVRKIANHFTVSEEDWKKTSFDYREQKDGVCVVLAGKYREVAVEFQIKIAPTGQLDIDYLVQEVPNGFLREEGLAFYLTNKVEHLDWKRKGYWNYYPDGAFAGNEGQTLLYTDRQVAYGEQPVQDWHEDSRNYYYWADEGGKGRKPLTQMAKGMKENIYFYTLSTGNREHWLSVISTDASLACRINKLSDERLVLYTNNRWDYPEIAWGNYCKKLEALPCFGSVRLRLQ